MPDVGVFWVYGEAVVGRAVALDAGEEGVPGLIDSPDTHAELWESEVLSTFPQLRGHEYFEIPRGRVLWDVNESRAMVYLDSSLNVEETKIDISRFFDLADVKAVWRTDAHYTTNQESLEALFSNE